MVETQLLQESYDYLQQKARLLFLTLTPDGDIVQANQYVASLIGQPIIGANLRDLVVDFNGTFALPDLLKNSSTEHLLNFKTASGLPQSLYLSFRRITDHIFVFGRLDITKLDNMQKTVLELNHELNNATRQLHKQNAQLQQLNREKNQFLGMAAHDLRKPIGLVLAYTEFVLDEASDALTAEHIGFLQTILQSCSSMKRLVDDFLDVSAIEAGKFELDLQPAHISEVLAQSLKLNTLQASKKKIALQIQQDADIPCGLMDDAKIEQVMTNLISNAIEHSSAGSSVTVRLVYEPSFVTFSVADQGPGIPEAEQAQLFKPINKTSIKKCGGEKSTGLGMLIARKIVESHDGKIWLSSRVGEGTTVYFKIPIRKLGDELRD